MQRSIILPVLVALSLVTTARGETPQAWATANLDDLVKLYRHFHQNPELSFDEEQTARRLADELRAAGVTVTEKVGGHGVVGVVTNGKGPTVLIRTDLDALPVAEMTGLAYASKVQVTDKHGATVGVMHACGHDLHITVLIAVTRYLMANKDRWSGTLVLIGQPAEERSAGAAAMIADGVLKRFPRPDYALALHMDSNLATGKVGVRAGYALANVDSIDIEIKGRGGHGAYPHTTIDPIVIAARLILDLQTIVAREVPPLEPSVVTVGSIHGGTKHNIIGESCHLQITVRSYSDDVRELLKTAIIRKAKAAADSSKAPEPEIAFSEGTPALFNDEKLAARLAPVFRRALGDDHVVEAEQSMGAEDFGRFRLEGIPIMMFRLGAVNPDRLAKYVEKKQIPPSLHSPLFYPDAQESITTGVTAMSAAVLDLLAPKQ